VGRQGDHRLKHTLGIDPGLSGAAAIINEDGTLVALTDLPIMRVEKLAWVDGNTFQTWLIENASFTPTECYIEHVNAMPKQGVTSSFHFGVGFGSLLSLIQARHIPLHLVRPAKWKRDLNLAGKDKKASLHRARRLWPTAELHLEKHEGRAEALLLAAWAINKGRG
jgi:hypothetical protein